MRTQHNLLLNQLLNPVFYERTKDGEMFYDIQSRLVKDRVIFLSEPLTAHAGGVIASLLFMMNNEDEDSQISIWLNTPGGDANAFLAIYDMMQMIKAPIQTVCLGQAQSAGALLLASGSRGLRYATPNSKIMIHQIQVGGVGGTGTEIAIAAEEIAQMKRVINEILARHTGQFIEKIDEDTEHDMHLTAQQALDYGIIDKIMPLGKALPRLKSVDNPKGLTEEELSIKRMGEKEDAVAKKAKKKATKKTASKKTTKKSSKKKV